MVEIPENKVVDLRDKASFYFNYLHYLMEGMSAIRKCNYQVLKSFGLRNFCLPKEYSL